MSCVPEFVCRCTIFSEESKGDEHGMVCPVLAETTLCTRVCLAAFLKEGSCAGIHVGSLAYKNNSRVKHSIMSSVFILSICSQSHSADATLINISINILLSIVLSSIL